MKLILNPKNVGREIKLLCYRVSKLEHKIRTIKETLIKYKEKRINLDTTLATIDKELEKYPPF